jgi:hypothetical protein
MSSAAAEVCKKSFSTSSVKTAWESSLVLFREYPHSQAAFAIGATGQRRVGGEAPAPNLLKREAARNSQGSARIVVEENMATEGLQ